ncbi:hypothetical protein ACU5DF_02330 [Aliivibrio wodanis]|uniref:hypothetical protein n=1 Tax=Aliivibrio wodanis TaxID=80852 RepID=UPI00406BE81A
MDILSFKMYKILKICTIVGIFSFLSFSLMSMVFFFSTPVIEDFVRYLTSKNLAYWFSSQFSDLESCFMNLLFIMINIITATLSVFTALIAKSYHEKAAKLVSEEINS